MRDWKNSTSGSRPGLVIAGFPANDFKGQEPGTNDEIQSFCTLNYGVKFPLFGKITVTGAEKHPLYAALIAAQPRPCRSISQRGAKS